MAEDRLSRSSYEVKIVRAFPGYIRSEIGTKGIKIQVHTHSHGYRHRFRYIHIYVNKYINAHVYISECV